MLETLIASVFTVNVSLLVIIINRIAKASQPHMSQKQEEDLHDYQEHQKGWEFKILRTDNDGFRRSRLLKLVCEEELETGWILLEKLDDSRLRFRRPVNFRERDRDAKIDPYRSHYGVPVRIKNFMSIFILLLLMAVPTFLGFTFMQNIFKSVRTQNLQSSPKTKLKPPIISTPKPITPAAKPLQ